MSPEQVNAERDLDSRSDIYSFGCIAYEMLTGTTPFKGGTPYVLMSSRLTAPPPPMRSIDPEIPEAAERAVATAMARNRNHRWESATEFAEAISNAAR
jgi:serine/threonine-protein kinase